jgi:cytochrome c biogenesis protein CcmG, thiol:disulfide interchange protein DsbE
MKKIIYILILTTYIAICQVPKVDIRDLNGKIVNTSNFNSDSGYVIINFWATWCKPCMRELENINEIYNEIENLNVRFIAISVDDARSASKIKPLITSKDWKYEVYKDTNGEFMRRMGVSVIPHTFVFYNGDLIWEHVGYSEGDEEILLDFMSNY